VYVAGTTTSPSSFGVSSGDLGMLYVKTHWDFNIELTTGPANTGGTTPEVVSLTYIKKRFITPKKFRNTVTPYVITFHKDIFSVGVVGDRLL